MFYSASLYDVHVYTGDVRGSGTNSNVFMTIYGDKGDTGERELKKSETHFDKFERNQVRNLPLFSFSNKLYYPYLYISTLARPALVQNFPTR